MNKTELVAAIANKAELTKKDSAAALEALTAAIREALQAGDKVVLPGFGTFEVRTRAAREGRNPQTGEKTSIPEKKVPGFKAGKALKEAVQ